MDYHKPSRHVLKGYPMPVLDTLPPPSLSEEKEHLEEKCQHWHTVRHSNGSLQCLRCKKMLIRVKAKWRQNETYIK